MKKITALLSALLLMLFASVVCAQSLSDLAKKEKERRDEITKSRTITDEEAEKLRSKLQTTPAPRETTSVKTDPAKNGSGTETGAKATKPESEEDVDFQGRPESYWRKTMSEARQSLKGLEDESNVLVLRLNSLNDQFNKMDDIGSNRDSIQREIQKTYYEQDKNKENLAKAKAALQDLENEARKSGALPGWLEPERR